MWWTLAAAHAATWTVGPAGDFPTVAAAEAAASNGDTILVEPGTYGELLTFDVSVTLRSTGGASVTTLHIDVGAARNTAIAIYSDLVIDGFTLTTSQSHQRCVRVWDSGSLHLLDSRVHHCGQADGLGSGIRVEPGATLTVDTSTFEDNAVTGSPSRGAHIWSNGDALVVRDSLFTRGSTGSGDGAAIFAAFGSVTLERNAFELNSAGDDGGALYIRSADPALITHNTFTGNTAVTLAGALYAETLGDHDIAHNQFCGNQAGTRGGAAFFRQVQPGPAFGSVRNNAFVDNDAGERGGAVFTFESAVELHHNHFLANSSPQGGAFATHFSLVSFTHNLVAWSPAGGGAWVDIPSGVADLDHNGWHANTGGDVTGDASLGAGAVFGDPELWSFANDGVCDPLEVLDPSHGSPLVDAGDAAVLDADGSRADIGAFGGPGDIPCAFSSDADGDGLCDPIDLDLALTHDPLLVGQPTTLTATGPDPGTVVAFVYGTALGPGPCPTSIGGLCLDVVDPVLIGTTTTDAAGTAALTTTVPAAAPLIDVHLQAVTAEGARAQKATVQTATLSP